MQLNFPSKFFMLRGNHESRKMTEHFTFREECLQKYDEETYDLFTDLFDNLPLAGVVANKYFAVHGGISPDVTSMAALDAGVNRF